METFWAALPVIFTLAGLEIILSGDNAIVLAALAQTLPKHQRNKALFYGLVGAFVLRFIAILCAQWLIKYWFLQVAGAAYLIWLGVTHVFSKPHEESHEHHATQQKSFWKVVVAIELTDLAFAVDSVLAAVALSQNLWIIYTGAMIGLIAMRFAASVVLKLLEMFPRLTTYAYIMVFWIGVKLGWHGVGHLFHDRGIPEKMPEVIFWWTMLVIAVAATLHGLISTYRKKSKEK